MGAGAAVSSETAKARSSTLRSNPDWEDRLADGDSMELRPSLPERPPRLPTPSVEKLRRTSRPRVQTDPVRFSSNGSSGSATSPGKPKPTFKDHTIGRAFETKVARCAGKQESSVTHVHSLPSKQVSSGKQECSVKKNISL